MKKGVISVLLLFLLPFLFIVGQSYDITDFGAKPDGTTLNTKAIQLTIDQCATNGGGKVHIPPGVFITGTVHLKSHVNLVLESGAVLRGSPDINNYEPYQTGMYDSTHYGIIYACKAENVTITGRGTIDGNEESFFHWDIPKKIAWGGTAYTRQGNDFRKVVQGIGDGPVAPVAKRPRQMIIFSQCRNVHVENVLLSKSPFWTLHFADCDGVTVTGVTIRNSLETPNSDGIDITSCSNVNVSDCNIRGGDDAIAITGYAYHFELPGYFSIRHSSENINISNCNLQSRSSGIRIGFEDQNTVRNINISNINITNSNRGIGIFVRDSGSIENVNIAQVNIETRLHTGDWWGNGEPVHISAIRGKPTGTMGKISHVTFRDIQCKSENGILIYGTQESIIEGLHFISMKMQVTNSPLNSTAGGNIDLRGCLDPQQQLFVHDIPAFYARYVKDLNIDDFSLSWDDMKEPFFTHGIHVVDFENVEIKNFEGKASTSASELKAVKLERGKKVKTDLIKSEISLAGVSGYITLPE